jgi:hypothetical protein
VSALSECSDDEGKGEEAEEEGISP